LWTTFAKKLGNHRTKLMTLSAWLRSPGESFARLGRHSKASRDGLATKKRDLSSCGAGIRRRFDAAERN
jgi:hypothetical protein